MRHHAIPEIYVDQVLIRNAGLHRHCLEIGDDVYAHADGELLLEPLGVRIGPTFHLSQIIFSFHGVPSG